MKLTGYKYNSLFFIGLICFLLTACKQDTPKSAEHAADNPHGKLESSNQPHGDLGAAHQQGQGIPGMGTSPKTTKTIVVPDSVKGKWSSVSIAVKDKSSGKSTSYDVKLNSEFEVPSTKLKVKIGDFLPDFSMGVDKITSESAEPNNPALHVTITEDGAEKYKGWLFAKYTEMHAFEHEKYAITLENKFGKSDKI